MRTSYESNTNVRFRAFGVFPEPQFNYPREIYKDYTAPIVRRSNGQLATDPATFGIVPRKHIPEGGKIFHTMNARAETIGEKLSFRSAWTKLQLCLISVGRFTNPTMRQAKPCAGESALHPENRWRLLDSGVHGRNPTEASR